MINKEIQRELTHFKNLDPALRYQIFMDYVRDNVNEADYLIAEIEAVNNGRKK